jgi:hypothetical protein
MASRSPEISVAVVAGQVAGVLSAQPRPPGIGLYPLLKTSIDNELAMLTAPPIARWPTRRTWQQVINR